MSHYPRYRKYYPAQYQAPKPLFWWVRKASYMKFITRELTSLFVAGVVVELVLLVRALAHSPAAYASFQAWLASPVALVLHALAFAMLVFHSVTWFNLAPQAMVLRLGTKRVPPWAIAGANFGAWAATSALLAWLLLA